MKSEIRNLKSSTFDVRRSMFDVQLWMAVVWLIFTSSSGFARINVVTLPDRDSVQLTIYNSADLTLVKETRVLTFRKGLNRLEFSWANTLIDPTSVEFKALNHAAEVDVLDVSFPPRVANTLEWRIASEFAGEVKVEIRYFTSGITWTADYVAEATRNEKTLDLAGAVKVTNNSGEDYENAQVRLVVGVIRLVEEIRALAQGPQRVPAATAPVLMEEARRETVTRALAKGLAASEARPREIVKEGLSEYFLYTVEGRDTIPNGWAKRLPSFATNAIPLASYYKYEKERWGEQVMRYYKFTNSIPSKLGNEPLPDGAVKAFRFVSEDNLYAFVGRTAVKYIPIGETVEMELGNDREVLVKPKLMDWEKTGIEFDQNGNIKGWTIKETWEIELQNSKEIEIMLDIRRNFPGDWDMTTAATYEAMDAHKVKFPGTLKPGEKQQIAYTLTTRYGTNARK